jgi:YVTN family beta-propeller protein
VGSVIWVASASTPPGTPGGGYLTALDPSGNIRQNFAVQQQPLALTAVQVYEGRTPNLYFVDPNSDFLWSLDPTTGDVLAVGQIGGFGARALLFDGTNLWISNSMSNTVSKMDKYGDWLGTFPVGHMPAGLAFDGNNIWVANYHDDNVNQLSVTGQVLQTIATGRNPGWIAFDGTNLVVTNSGSNTLMTIRATDGAVLAHVVTGLRPAGVVFDDFHHPWVANSGSNTVTRY